MSLHDLYSWGKPVNADVPEHGNTRAAAFADASCIRKNAHRTPRRNPACTLAPPVQSPGRSGAHLRAGSSGSLRIGWTAYGQRCGSGRVVPRLGSGQAAGRPGPPHRGLQPAQCFRLKAELWRTLAVRVPASAGSIPSPSGRRESDRWPSHNPQRGSPHKPGSAITRTSRGRRRCARVSCRP